MSRAGSKRHFAVRAVRAGFAYTDALAVFEDASFVLDHGWTGLAGENGAGKSTLLRLLAGELHASEGTLEIEPEWARAVLCPQSVDERPSELAALAEASDARAGRLRAQLRLDAGFLSRFATLSPGERKRWQLAAALYVEPELLLLDEPSNHLDADARSWAIAALREFSGLGVIVSHDRALLDALTHTTLRIHHGQLRAWSGSYTPARELWEAERLARIERRHTKQFEQKRQRALLDQLRRDEQAAARQRNTGRRMKDKNDSDARSIMASVKAEWSAKSLGKRVAASHRRTERASEALDELAVEKELGRSVFVQHERAHRAWLLQLPGPITLPGREDAPLVVPAVARDARIWLRGPNGAGKTTILRTLVEHAPLPADRLLYLPQSARAEQDRSTLREVRAEPPAQRGRLLSIAAALGIDPDRLLASEQPSPGEARKLAIARGLSEQRFILVLDEPENHLDLPSIERLERALTAYPGALLLVSHDAALATKLTTVQWAVSTSGLEVSDVPR
jgi:ATPase subunit of ABC transporter with duplicated ATPase domains